MLVAHWDLIESAGEIAELLLSRIGGDDACTACFQAQLERRKPPYVPVHQDTDPDRVRELVKALELEGFDPRGVGLESAALFGEGQDLFAAWIEVPEGQKTDAEAVLKRILAPAPAIEFTAELPALEE